MELIELVRAYGEYGAVGVIVILLIIAVRYSVKKHEACTDEQKKSLKEHRDDFKGMADKMFEVVNSNTQSITQFSEAVKELGRR